MALLGRLSGGISDALLQAIVTPLDLCCRVEKAYRVISGAQRTSPWGREGGAREVRVRVLELFKPAQLLKQLVHGHALLQTPAGGRREAPSSP